VWLNAHPIGTWVGYTFWLDVGGTTPLAKIVFPDNIAPYNTYHNSGLPPTPICSPGLASIQAALSPDTTDGYYYFLAKNDGSNSLAFAHTNAEQIANEKKYGYIK
jgi:cell division protein YceG involved in septum cleavage